MKVPEAVLERYEAADDDYQALEAALEQLRVEQLAYLDGLTFDSHDKTDYRNGWNDCREDVERAYAVLGEQP